MCAHGGHIAVIVHAIAGVGANTGDLKQRLGRPKQPRRLLLSPLRASQPRQALQTPANAPRVLNLAYNDRAGVTAAFNLNLLVRLNRELGTDFDLDRFQHRAFYNEDEGRIEMHLDSLADQVVHVGGEEIAFRKGESIWTESSHKYTIEEFHTIAAPAGFAPEKVWTDDRDLFSVHLLKAE